MVKARKVESSIRSRRTSAELAAQRKKQKETALVVFFVGLFLKTLWTIVSTCYQHPLKIPFPTDDLAWSNAWLWATVVDYYGSTLCFSAIVLASSTSWKVGFAWVASFCLAGSPACCVWILLRWYKTKSLRMEKVSEKKEDGSASAASENATLL